MERYDNYKDCGIYYLPLLPSDWQILRAKYLFKQEQRPVKDSDEIITCFRDGQVTLRRNRRIDGFTNSLKEIGYQGVRRGDLVIHNMDAFAGAIGISDSDGKATPVYSCCTPLLESIDSYYYCFFLRYLAKSNFILSLAKGIRERSTDFRFSDFKKLYLPVPSYSEQQAIVAYLDKETGKLDAAVEKLERMVEVLNERKQLIISKAVTRGLGDSVPLKDSGVEWIGQIPEHWSINRFKAIFTLNTGISFTKADLVETGQPVISYGQVHSKLNQVAKANLSLIKYIPQSLTIGKQKSYCLPNDFIFADTSEDFEGCGNNFYNDSELSVFAGSHTILAKLRCNLEGKYLAYLFSTSLWRQQIRSRVNGVKVFSITQSILKATSVILPPIAEQQAIAAYLDEKVGKLDEAIEKQLRMIELLKERKQILISDVVTGKIKVA